MGGCSLSQWFSDSTLSSWLTQFSTRYTMLLACHELWCFHSCFWIFPITNSICRQFILTEGPDLSASPFCFQVVALSYSRAFVPSPVDSTQAPKRASLFFLLADTWITEPYNHTLPFSIVGGSALSEPVVCLEFHRPVSCPWVLAHGQTPVRKA